MGAEGADTNHKRGGKKAKNHGPKPKMTKEERRKKYTDIARKRRDKQNGIRRRNNMVCYNCRQPGHNASECPQLGESSQATTCTPTSSTVLCYKCGSTEHALHKCPKRHRGDRNDLPFATCFICNQKGHLASACSQNASGIYVNGGSCRKCGSTQHLATDCPLKKKNQAPQEEKDKEENNDLLQDLVETDPSSTLSKTKQDTQKKKKSESSEKPKKKKRVVNF